MLLEQVSSEGQSLTWGKTGKKKKTNKQTGKQVKKVRAEALKDKDKRLIICCGLVEDNTFHQRANVIAEYGMSSQDGCRRIWRLQGGASELML